MCRKSELASYKPLGVKCPLDGQMEIIQHALFHCKLIDTAFKHISACFQDWTEGPHGIKLLLDTKVAEFLPTPIGVLAWTALHANWKVRNTARASPEAQLTDDYFFCIWKGVLSLFLN